MTKCARWDADEFPNIADFDVAVLDAYGWWDDVSAAVATQNHVRAERLTTNASKAYQGIWKLLRSGGDVIVVGVARDGVFAGGGLSQRPYAHSWEWCPLPLETEDETGERIFVADKSFLRYLEHVERWSFSYKVNQSADVVARVQDAYGDSAKVMLGYLPIATNRSGGLLAAYWRFKVHRWHLTDSLRTSRELCQEPEVTSGSLIVLPPPTAVDRRAAINIILEDVVGIPQTATPPVWVESVPVPGIADLSRRRESLLEDIHKAQLDVESIEGQIRELDAHRQLLYESGVPLEIACRKVLTAMGATIREAQVAQEDFVIEFGHTTALAEVKGNTKSASMSDAAQLGRYRETYRSQHGGDIHGLLIVNAYRNLPLAERKKWFPDDVIAYARQAGIGLVSTWDLFDAYCAVLAGKATGNAVLTRLLKMPGVVELL